MQRFKSMPNFRRLAEDGSNLVKNENEKKISQLNIYRSSRPDFLSPDEIEIFRTIGIRSIIDFRSANEYRKATGLKLLDEYYPPTKVNLPTKFRYNPGDMVVYTPLRLQNGVESTKDKAIGKHFLINFFRINYIWSIFNRAPWYIRLYSLLFLIFDLIFNTGYRYFVRVFAKHVLNKDGLYGQYRDMVDFSQAPICAALKLLSDPDNVPAMLNCAHGKDRTGIVSALVMGCLGYSRDEIAAEYAKSEVGLLPMQARLEAEIVDQFQMCTTFVSAKAETMARVVDYIESNYGSICNYLESIGFTKAEQEALRINLTSQLPSSSSS